MVWNCGIHQTNCSIHDTWPMAVDAHCFRWFKARHPLLLSKSFCGTIMRNWCLLPRQVGSSPWVGKMLLWAMVEEAVCGSLPAKHRYALDIASQKGIRVTICIDVKKEINIRRHPQDSTGIHQQNGPKRWGTHPRPPQELPWMPSIATSKRKHVFLNYPLSSTRRAQFWLRLECI